MFEDCLVIIRLSVEYFFNPNIVFDILVKKDNVCFRFVKRRIGLILIVIRLLFHYVKFE